MFVYYMDMDKHPNLRHLRFFIHKKTVVTLTVVGTVIESAFKIHLTIVLTKSKDKVHLLLKQTFFLSFKCQIQL